MSARSTAALASFAMAAKKVLLLRHDSPPPSPPPPMPAVVPTLAPTLLLERPPPSLPRSCVTHAVLGSEVAGLHSLPPEILAQTFSKLDPLSLCRLACVSQTCRSFAEDQHVWEASPAGVRKPIVRARWWQAAQVRAALEAAEALERRQQWRRRKRRALRALEVLCGVVVMCFALLLSARSRREGGAVASRKGEASAPPLANHAAPSSHRAVPAAQIQQIVWRAAAAS